MKTVNSVKSSISKDSFSYPFWPTIESAEIWREAHSVFKSQIKHVPSAIDPVLWCTTLKMLYCENITTFLIDHPIALLGSPICLICVLHNGNTHQVRFSWIMCSFDLPWT